MEWRQIHFLQRAFGQVRAVIVASARGRAIAGEVLGARHHAAAAREVRSLDTAHLRYRHARAKIGVLACPLDHPSPTRIARYVDHGCEGPMQARRPGLLRCDPARLFRHIQIPARRQCEGHRQDGAIAVDHVHCEKKRNTKARLRHCYALQRAQWFGTGNVEQRAHLAAPHPVEHRRIEPRVQRLLPSAGYLGHLPQLLGERHPADEVAHASPMVALRPHGRARHETGRGKDRTRREKLSSIGAHARFNGMARRSRADW